MFLGRRKRYISFLFPGLSPLLFSTTSFPRNKYLFLLPSPYFLFFRIFANKPFGKYGKWNEEEEEEEPTSHNTQPDEKPSSVGGGWSRREGNNLFSTAWLFWEEEVARAGSAVFIAVVSSSSVFLFPPSVGREKGKGSSAFSGLLAGAEARVVYEEEGGEAPATPHRGKKGK